MTPVTLHSVKRTALLVIQVVFLALVEVAAAPLSAVSPTPVPATPVMRARWQTPSNAARRAAKETSARPKISRRQAGLVYFLLQRMHDTKPSNGS